MIRIGLTGSVGMGKSTTARLFAKAGVPVHDADATVHRLYAGRAVPLIEEAFPGVTRDGAVDRMLLKQRVFNDPSALKRLEEIVHPLVHEEEALFIQAARVAGHGCAVLDIPLLFETGADDRVDVTLVVTAAAEVQRARVMSRPTMDEETFQAILAKQMPDAEKRKRAHFLLDTGHGMASAERAVRALLRSLSFMGRP